MTGRFPLPSAGTRWRQYRQDSEAAVYRDQLEAVGLYPFRRWAGVVSRRHLETYPPPALEPGERWPDVWRMMLGRSISWRDAVALVLEDSK